MTIPAYSEPTYAQSFLELSTKHSLESLQRFCNTICQYSAPKFPSFLLRYTLQLRLPSRPRRSRSSTQPLTARRSLTPRATLSRLLEEKRNA